MIAAERGHAELVCLLLEKNADVSATDCNGQQALDLAVGQECIALLKERTTSLVSALYDDDDDDGGDGQAMM
jgi:ankyrin repeat protein